MFIQIHKDFGKFAGPLTWQPDPENRTGSCLKKPVTGRKKTSKCWKNYTTNVNKKWFGNVKKHTKLTKSTEIHISPIIDTTAGTSNRDIWLSSNINIVMI